MKPANTGTPIAPSTTYAVTAMVLRRLPVSPAAMYTASEQKDSGMGPMYTENGDATHMSAVSSAVVVTVLVLIVIT